MNGLVACVAVSGATFPTEDVDAIQIVSDEEMRAAQRNDLGIKSQTTCS